VFYHVLFHQNRTETHIAQFDCVDGAYVITDADRGIDIGRIISRTDRPSPRDLKATRTILRLATPQEIAGIADKQGRERVALQLCQAKVRELALEMEITGAEYQFDGKKLTFYYSAAKFVDFRDLVRVLFRTFGTRIWMVWFDGNAPVRDVFTRGS
jgi:cell fate regulator YaaT (PSP1 superfamily)